MTSSTGLPPKKQKLTPIQVFLRIRPKNESDGILAITYCTPKEIHVKGHTKAFTFDQIFDEKTSQVKVYKTVVSKMINDVMKGYNCTVFAYGQTGTGKTYTILGGETVKPIEDSFDWQQEADVGIIMRATMHLYEELGKMDPNVQRTVTVSFMEIYNEEIRDLLCDKEPMVPLRIYEDKSRMVHVKNLQECTVLSPLEIFALLKKGCDKRQVASTLMNHRSSRSHTVFTITVSTIQTVSVAGNLSNITCGKLNLIDLAGSENIAKSGSKEQRAREATNINQSLLTLGRVIKALVENSQHVPYRESKLTRILQDSLGGKTKTSIIATISPGLHSLEETVNTLDYAFNARNVTNCPTINLRTSATAAAVQEELLRLKRDLFATANEQGVYMDQENYDQMTQSLTQYKKDIVMKHEAIKALTEQVDNLSAEKEEWENLKKSFERTRQAYQDCQSEIQYNKSKMHKDNLLLDYYEGESAKLQEFVDFMAQRDLRLQQKVDNLYATSTNNQNVTERIIMLMEKFVDDILTAGSNSSVDIIHDVSCLKDFNDKICHMLNNVKDQLLNQAAQKHQMNSVESTEQSEGLDYLQVLVLDTFSHDFEDKLKNIITQCDSKIEELNQKLKSSLDDVSDIVLVINNLKNAVFSKILEVQTTTSKYCGEDDEIGKQLINDMEYFSEKQDAAHTILVKNCEDDYRDDVEDLQEVKKTLEAKEKRLKLVSEDLQEHEARLKAREKWLRDEFDNLQKDKEMLLLREKWLKDEHDELEKCKHRLNLSEEKMRVKQELPLYLRKVKEEMKFKEAVERSNVKRNILKEKIQDSFNVEEVNFLLKEAVKQVEQISKKLLLNTNKICELNLQENKLVLNQQTEAQNVVIKMINEVIRERSEMIEKFSKEKADIAAEKGKMVEQYAKEGSEMANVLDQISHILNIEGKTQLDQLKLKFDSNNEVINSISHNMKQDVEQTFKSSLVPVKHIGDTPGRLQAKPQNIRRSRDSLVKTLTLELNDENRNTDNI